MAEKIAQWLEQHGLSQYAEVFADNKIDPPPLTDPVAMLVQKGLVAARSGGSCYVRFWLKADIRLTTE